MREQSTTTRSTNMVVVEQGYDSVKHCFYRVLKNGVRQERYGNVWF